MKHKLLGSFLGAYLIFLIGSFLTALCLIPVLVKNHIEKIAVTEGTAGVIQQHIIALQNICCIMLVIIFLLSLIPLIVFWKKIYRPLLRTTKTAIQYADNTQPNPPSLEYSGDDELSVLNASINYLAETNIGREEYQRKFISNISHDFRSPLTSIKGYVEAIQDGTIPIEMQEKYLNIVLKETQRLNKLTEGLLTLNTFDDRGIYLDQTEFELKETIRNTVATLEGIGQQKNIKILTFFPNSPVMVYADMGKIEQVLYNLIDNAIKFSSPDSEIRIQIQSRRNRIYVSIKDYGEGISRDNLPKIWDRFYKTDSSRGRDKKGTGLGLSIVKEIITAHNQNIDVISTEGAGTEFVFTLKKAA